MKKSFSDRRENVRRGVYILPNLVTTGSLFAGFYGIVASMNHKYDVAAWFILVSAVFDTLDGKIARLTNTTSQFGVEYDSLSDLVAFGVAPGVLMYTWALQPFGKLGWLAAFLYVVCGALRLARFNVQASTVESKNFIGLPIPAAASMVAACVLLFYHLGGTGTIRMVSVLVLIYGLAVLMVSNVPYYSFKDPELYKRRPFGILVLAIVLIIVIVAQPAVMFFIIFLTYTMFSPVLALMGYLRRRREKKVSQG
ncbi:CDP-diacylglycerol--serine O-phosphatidyltransferase [Desulfuromonas acetoxidans]|uniref:CDP-diacylglycerol--serine O-phosphatidyltransferase n=1 Tax=Desulfuromonas acetoxidans (strain DSM 684 / 11070) TaxID=281689 RepID=Q1K339_DESA6|nr:CDP-diacylglycerol--serine O-phosphatidyltransferase [Desulfuromonas acetoxidans]EAT16692.1 CDP-diacylglycerol--serine O-phosphatidyltransferase [Desulfuromonas acetoxidans DSM 684]MBF0644836.1 CDP-diacylglycerol--serine O-phosphatidyltransferase [Desulfuromonas acetoxidans]NVD23631.1 CDP-diacylglycerol--serine O-phosphatidyltransferase [Desulfuromonas acetoxidans]NVE15984.1 CDP-diacylglycerol--serine O-phosphatidyltransferase [Desulfuromonas acetoxidans]